MWPRCLTPPLPFLLVCAGSGGLSQNRISRACFPFSLLWAPFNHFWGCWGDQGFCEWSLSPPARAVPQHGHPGLRTRRKLVLGSLWQITSVWSASIDRSDQVSGSSGLQDGLGEDRLFTSQVPMLRGKVTRATCASECKPSTCGDRTHKPHSSTLGLSVLWGFQGNNLSLAVFPVWLFQMKRRRGRRQL